MIHIKLFEDYTINDLISKIKSFDNFTDFCNNSKVFTKNDMNILLKWVENFNNKYSCVDSILLYHGTPKYKDILDNGFKITNGQRSGFMGSTKQVENQGIFLTDSKIIAHRFGENRGDRNYKVLSVCANIHNILDFSELKNIPKDIIKLGLNICNAYNGSKKTKLARKDIWWLLDNKDFCNLIKENGYDSVKFQEEYTQSKKDGDINANTYLVFDVKKLSLKTDKLNTLEEVFNQIKKQ